MHGELRESLTKECAQSPHSHDLEGQATASKCGVRRATQDHEPEPREKLGSRGPPCPGACSPNTGSGRSLRSPEACRHLPAGLTCSHSSSQPAWSQESMDSPESRTVLVRGTECRRALPRQGRGLRTRPQAPSPCGKPAVSPLIRGNRGAGALGTVPASVGRGATPVRLLMSLPCTSQP